MASTAEEMAVQVADHVYALFVAGLSAQKRVGRVGAAAALRAAQFRVKGTQRQQTSV